MNDMNTLQAQLAEAEAVLDRYQREGCGADAEERMERRIEELRAKIAALPR